MLMWVNFLETAQTYPMHKLRSRKVTKIGNLDAGFTTSFDEQSSRGRGELFPVDCEGYVSHYSLCASRVNMGSTTPLSTAARLPLRTGTVCRSNGPRTHCEIS